jgi:hypothetical protein
MANPRNYVYRDDLTEKRQERVVFAVLELPNGKFLAYLRADGEPSGFGNTPREAIADYLDITTGFAEFINFHVEAI